MIALLTLIILAAAFWLFWVCVQGWWFSYDRLRQGKPVLEQESGPTVGWGALDVFGGMVLFAMVSTAFLSASLLIAGFTEFSKEALKIPNAKIAFLWGYSFTELFVFCVMALAIYLRMGGGFLFGKSMKTFVEDLKLGFIAYAMSIFPVILIQVILTQFWEYEHELIDDFKDNASIALAIPTILAAVICAPLFEEFAIRLLLQGWLGDWMAGRYKDLEVLWGHWSRFPKQQVGEDLFKEPLEVEPLVPITDDIVQAQSVDSEVSFAEEPTEIEEASSDNPYAATRSAPDPRQFLEPGETEPLPKYWQFPILISATIFAALHIGQGPAPIPLFFLALVLGYLYQRTRRLTPCLVVHFLLNAQSMFLLVLQIMSPE